MKKMVITENFLDADLFNRLIVYADEIWRSKHNTFKTNHHWVDYIIKDSNIILAHDIPQDTSIYRDLRNYVKNIDNFSIVNELMLYYYSPGCHIPWHDDSHCDGAATIYLNDDWDKNWGGLFLYDQGDGIRGLVPKKNMMAFQPGGIPHSVSVLSPQAPVRVTVQAFMGK